MKELPSALGRLSLLSKVVHWVCRSKNWAQIRSLYEAIVESIEMGEEDWMLDFSHYEAMVPVFAGENREIKNKEKEKKEGEEIHRSLMV